MNYGRKTANMLYTFRRRTSSYEHFDELASIARNYGFLTALLYDFKLSFRQSAFEGRLVKIIEGVLDLAKIKSKKSALKERLIYQ